MNSMYEILSEYAHNPHYLNRYIKFINSRNNNNTYVEKHHICMKSMFPDLANFSEFPWNCVLLSPREHYIAHLLLWKTYRNRAASYAFHIMIHGDKYSKRYKKISSRTYEKLIQECRALNTGYGHPLFGTKRSEESKIKQSLSMKGKKQSLEHIHSRVASFKCTMQGRGTRTGITHNPESIEKMRQAHIGKHFTEEHLANMRKRPQDTTVIVCPHCSKIGDYKNMKRWHMDRCKHNPNRITDIDPRVVTCTKCGHTVKASPNFYRYHNEHCKSRP